MINSLAAIDAGATRVHGAAIGIGERVGNTPMDTLIVNLVLMGYIERDLSALVEYREYVSQATGVAIPPNYPVVGRDAFRTATGVHAAAVIKAFRKQDRALADAVYSGVPASLVGREQEIEVGPMSGQSNVLFWLEQRGLPVTDGRRRSHLRERQGVRGRAARRRNPAADRAAHVPPLTPPPGPATASDCGRRSARAQRRRRRRQPGETCAESLSSVSSARCQAG